MTAVLERNLPAWTEEDIARQPEDGSKYEILDGSLFVTPPADEVHQGICNYQWKLLERDAPAGWRVRTDIGLKVGADRFEPDIAVLRPGAPRGEVWTDGAHFALVVEVESDSTRTNDKGNKMLKYAEAGIPSYWRIERSVAGPVIHIYELPDAGGAYEHIATVRPGETFTVSQPFKVTAEPDALID
jgi:Uma2 family endonuclease